MDRDDLGITDVDFVSTNVSLPSPSPERRDDWRRCLEAVSVEICVLAEPVTYDKTSHQPNTSSYTYSFQSALLAF